MIRFLVFFCLAVAFLSCEKESLRGVCLEPRNVAMRIQCVQRIDTNTRDTALRSPILVPVGGKGAIQYKSPTVFLQAFPSPLTDSCRYIVFPDSVQSVADTLLLTYTRQLHFISTACGFTHHFELKSASASNAFIDSVRITNPLIDNNANSTPHLRMYIHRP